MPSSYKYTTDELGFNRVLTKGSIFDVPDQFGPTTVGATNVFTGGSSAENFISGELGANVTVVDGHLQSSNFETGNTGWKIDADGNLEANDGNFRGDLTGATGTFSSAIAIGSGNNIIKADDTDGFWVGHANFASAPAKITLGGAATFTNITISGGTGVANLSDAGNLATEDTVGASDCDTTIISGGYIITGLLTADNIQAGTLEGRTVKATGGAGVDVWVQNDGYVRYRYGSSNKAYMASDVNGNLRIDADNEISQEYNSDGGGNNWYVWEDGGVAMFFDSSKNGYVSNGDFDISGTLSKGGGSFKIDHPLKPETHYLYHSFVESPDMLNIYKGRSKTKNKKCTIELPDYFEALNKEFEYQLTPIKSLARLGISKEVKNNKFEVMSDEDCEFSWIVMGVRKDPYALANPIVTEVEKPIKGYVHPELYGEDQNIYDKIIDENAIRKKKKKPQIKFGRDKRNNSKLKNIDLVLPKPVNINRK